MNLMEIFPSVGFPMKQQQKSLAGLPEAQPLFKRVSMPRVAFSNVRPSWGLVEMD